MTSDPVNTTYRSPACSNWSVRYVPFFSEPFPFPSPLNLLLPIVYPVIRISWLTISCIRFFVPSRRSFSCQLPTAKAVGLPFHLPDRLGSGRSAIGWLTSALDAMFFAALISALSVYPHLIQTKSDWVFRFSLLV